MMHYLDLTIIEIHKAFIEKKITPLDLTLEAIKRAKENDLNAFECIDEEGAIAFASSLKEPEEDNLLWGIPYVAKDNFSTKGIETSASSHILDGYVPLFDATCIEKLKERKCILIGKTTMDELAMGALGNSGRKGATYNPYDPSHKRIIGGSSCGSAASVAAGIVPFALGSDTGDSVRKPASFGGLVGYKPTWGRISRYGLFPFAPSMDHVGFFTRSVGDASILLNALSGHDDKDMTSSFKDIPNVIKDEPNFLKGRRIAVISEIINDIDNPILLQKFNETIDALRHQDVTLDFVSFPKKLLSLIRPAYLFISSAEATSNNANLDGVKFGPYRGGASYEEVMFNARNQGFSDLIKKRFVIGSFALMKENQDDLYLRAKKIRAMIVKTVNDIFSNYDFIYLPTAPSIAPFFDDKPSDKYPLSDNHLILGNFAGLPSISVPFCFDQGMPLGVSVMGKAYADNDVLMMARAVETITGLKGLSCNNKKGDF